MKDQGNSRARLLIADDEVFIREGLQDALREPDLDLQTAADAREVRRRLRKGAFDVILLDLRMPGVSGMDLLDEIRERHPESNVVILTAHGSVDTAVEAMKKGAFDFVTKPVDLTHLRLIVNRALDRVRLVRENRELHDRLGRGDSDDPFRRIVRRSASMQQATRTVKQVALSDVPVLIRGETGPARSCSREPSTSAAAGAKGRSFPSTAAASPRTCSAASCSATSAAPSPGPTSTGPAASPSPRRAPCSSTKSARSP